MRIRRRKNRMLFHLMVIAYLVFFLIWVYDQSIPTDILRYGTIEESFFVHGVIVRDESAYAVDLDGLYVPVVPEGTRVAKDSLIAHVMRDETQALVTERMRKVQEYMHMKMTFASKHEITAKNVEGYRTRITDELSVLYDMSNSYEVRNMHTLYQNINRIIADQIAFFTVYDAQTPQEQVLKASIDALDDAIARHRIEVRTKESGYVSYVIDGFEDFFDFYHLSDLSLDSVDHIIERTKEIQAQDMQPTVSKDMPFAKVIRDHVYRIIFEMDLEHSVNIKPESSILLRFSSLFEDIRATVLLTHTDASGRKYAVLESNVYIGQLTSMRVVPMEVIPVSHSGYKVPLEALIMHDRPNATIIINKNGFASFEPVTVVASNRHYAIIQGESLRLYDTYITDPRNIKEGQVIES